MPETGRLADALRLYATGAASDGGAVVAADRNLGGHRSSEIIAQRGVASDRVIPGVAVEWASAANGLGAGRLEAVANNAVAWTPPGGSKGPRVVIRPGTARIVPGDDPSRCVRVRRVTANPIKGRADVDVARVLGGALGMPDAPAAGESRYHAVIARNESRYRLTGVSAGLTQLGSTFTSDAFQLASSGGGTVAASSLAAADWPDTGFARIVGVGSSLEVVYYESKIGSGVVVPAAGRGLFGTTAKAGNASDQLTPVSPLRIASETPAADGSIQTIANATTAPTGLTWSVALAASAEVTPGAMEPGETIGLWLHRHTPAGAAATAYIENAITIDYTGA